MPSAPHDVGPPRAVPDAAKDCLKIPNEIHNDLEFPTLYNGTSTSSISSESSAKLCKSKSVVGKTFFSPISNFIGKVHRREFFSTSNEEPVIPVTCSLRVGLAEKMDSPDMLNVSTDWTLQKLLAVTCITNNLEPGSQMLFIVETGSESTFRVLESANTIAGLFTKISHILLFDPHTVGDASEVPVPLSLAATLRNTTKKFFAVPEHQATSYSTLLSSLLEFHTETNALETFEASSNMRPRLSVYSKPQKKEKVALRHKFSMISSRKFNRSNEIAQDEAASRKTHTIMPNNFNSLVQSKRISPARTVYGRSQISDKVHEAILLLNASREAIVSRKIPHKIAQAIDLCVPCELSPEQIPLEISILRPSLLTRCVPHFFGDKGVARPSGSVSPTANNAGAQSPTSPQATMSPVIRPSSAGAVTSLSSHCPIPMTQIIGGGSSVSFAAGDGKIKDLAETALSEEKIIKFLRCESKFQAPIQRTQHKNTASALSAPGSARVHKYSASSIMAKPPQVLESTCEKLSEKEGDNGKNDDSETQPRGAALRSRHDTFCMTISMGKLKSLNLLGGVRKKAPLSQSFQLEAALGGPHLSDSSPSLKTNLNRPSGLKISERSEILSMEDATPTEKNPPSDFMLWKYGDKANDAAPSDFRGELRRMQSVNDGINTLKAHKKRGDLVSEPSLLKVLSKMPGTTETPLMKKRLAPLRTAKAPTELLEKASSHFFSDADFPAPSKDTVIHVYISAPRRFSFSGHCLSTMELVLMYACECVDVKFSSHTLELSFTTASPIELDRPLLYYQTMWSQLAKTEGFNTSVASENPYLELNLVQKPKYYNQIIITENGAEVIHFTVTNGCARVTAVEKNKLIGFISDTPDLSILLGPSNAYRRYLGHLFSLLNSEENKDVAVNMAKGFGSNKPGEERVLKDAADYQIASLYDVYELQSYENRFMDTLFMTYRCKMQANEIFQLMLARFNSVPPADYSDEEETYYLLNKVILQLKIINAIGKWVEGYWNDFALNAGLEKSLEVFLAELAKCEFFAPAAAAINSVIANARLVFDKMLEEHRIAQQKSKTMESIIHEYTPVEVAQQLTLYNWRIVQSIHPIEYLNQLWIGTSKERDISPSLNYFISRFDLESYWATWEICHTKDLKKRIAILSRFIDIAGECLSLNNFFSAFSLLAGISALPVERLKKTWKGLSTESQSYYAQVSLICDPSRNMKNYRDVLSEAKPPIVPFLALYMKELIFLNDGNPTFLSNKLLNFEKLTMISERVNEIARSSKYEYQFAGNPELLNFLRKPPAERDLEKLKALSHECEPKKT